MKKGKLTREQKIENNLIKMEKEIELVGIKKGFKILKSKSNKKMEDYFCYMPSINCVEIFNKYIDGKENRKAFLESQYNLEILYNYTKKNSICNKERCSICSNYCYCDKARFQKNNLSSRLNVLLQYLVDENKYWNIIKSQLTLEDINILRINTEGDMLYHDYVSKWFEIMDMFPDVKFYSYTKQFEYFKYFKYFPYNFTLQLSFDVNSDYEIPEDLLKKGNVNIFLTYKTMEDVEMWIEKNGFTMEDIKNCKGKCELCRNCYSNKGKIHLCKLH